MDDETGAIVIELAREFIDLVRSLDGGWIKGYYRFRAEYLRYGSNASYLGSVGVVLIGALKHRQFYDSMNQKGLRLLKHIGKESGVFLLEIDNNFDYHIHFDWADLHRWEITKMDGRTGMPEGI